MERKVQSYGKQNFESDVLAFLENGTLNSSIQAEFSPKDVRTYLNGVLLVFKESRQWTAGIYVDAGSLGGLGGSGLEVWPWGEQVAWIRIKVRQPYTLQRPPKNDDVKTTSEK